MDLISGSYAKAFNACRRHRVDFNVFLEHNREAFMRNIPQFLEQVSDVDYINLFLTSVGYVHLIATERTNLTKYLLRRQGSLSDATVSDLCDAVRIELEKKDVKQYVNSILTAHVVKRPPDHEAGLSLLLRLRGIRNDIGYPIPPLMMSFFADTEPRIVEDAVKYIIFLVDADRLFDTALGMYDFSLVLMIAQHAQKVHLASCPFPCAYILTSTQDPREYLPFLRELRALDEHYQRFRIDDHLKRYEKALQHLADAGQNRSFCVPLTMVLMWCIYRP